MVGIGLVWNKSTLEVVGIRLQMKRHMQQCSENSGHFGSDANIDMPKILMLFLKIMKRKYLLGIRDHRRFNHFREAVGNQKYQIHPPVAPRTNIQES